MTLKEFFLEVGGDYDEVLARLITEDRVRKYLNKFADGNDCDQLTEDIANQKWEDAFRGAHSMKGMCMNLGLGTLKESSSELCETMRDGAPQVDVEPLLEKVQVDYAAAIGAIGRLE